MACCPTDNDDGYITASFGAISFALALVAAGLIAHAGAELRSAREEYQQIRTAHFMDGVILEAAVAIMGERGTPRLRWTMSRPAGPVFILAEPEQAKLNPRRTSNEALTALLVRFDVADPARATRRLTVASMPGSSDRTLLLRAADGPAWQDCSFSFVSPFGTAGRPPTQAATVPRPQVLNWRPGQLWRISVVSSDGRGEDRVVRFTGDPKDPIATIDRITSRNASTQYRCDTFLKGKP